MKKLPIGIQTLRDIINEDYVYVDKTAIALRLIQQGKYYFLSRPRRFGKSLFLDTLKEIFEGNKQLFSGLYIEDKWDFDKTHPVLRISFGSGVSRSLEELRHGIRWILEDCEDALGIQCDSKIGKVCFRDLIRKAYKKFNQKVVILIDEYDKPILDNITEKETARLIRDEMKGFYSVIKDNDQYIQFVFITGVSKFSKMNLFSGLNNLNDITLNPNFATICGYTHDDLRDVFKEHLAGVDLEKVKKWYNGYNYFGERVYNPFDVLLFISNNHHYKNYWWSTGNPSFLIDLINSKPYSIPDVENFEATDAILDSFDVDRIELEALLWQTGYLTIKEKYTKRGLIKYRLEVPNLEIQFSLNDFFIDVLTTQKREKLRFQDKIYDL
ncbi:MAG: AAA family ATPase, partial [Bacteroidetes bacterium]|nr:AAA family ATPase [Bacteroidota bacterium]